MKYKVGDKVRVREDLIIDIDYGKEKFVSYMTPFKGKEVTISYVDSCGYYRIKEDITYRWTNEMFSKKVSEDSTKEIISQNIFPKEENSYDIITIKTTKVKLLLL